MFLVEKKREKREWLVVSKGKVRENIGAHGNIQITFYLYCLNAYSWIILDIHYLQAFLLTKCLCDTILNKFYASDEWANGKHIDTTDSSRPPQIQSDNNRIQL